MSYKEVISLISNCFSIFGSIFAIIGVIYGIKQYQKYIKDRYVSSLGDVRTYLEKLRLHIHWRLGPATGMSPDEIYSEEAKANQDILTYMSEQRSKICSIVNKKAFAKFLPIKIDEVNVNVNQFLGSLERWARTNLNTWLLEKQCKDVTKDKEELREKMEKMLEEKEKLLALIMSTIDVCNKI